MSTTHKLATELTTDIVDARLDAEATNEALEAVEASPKAALLLEIERGTKNAVAHRAALRIAAPEELRESIMNAIRNDDGDDDGIGSKLRNLFGK